MLNPKVVYEVAIEDEGRTMKEFLRKKKKISRKLLVRLKKEKSIFLNGEFTYLDRLIKAGDTITLIMPEEESENVRPQNLPIDIVFEDEDVMVLNKPAGQCVHPSRLHPDGTLANGVAYYWRQQGFKRKFRPVNRLDRDTSGLLIVAKNQFAHQQLAISQQKGQINRIYEAFVHGTVERNEGTISAPIARKMDSIMLREVRADGQEAITHYFVLERFKDVTYVRLKLETGRTHQIRAHMSYLGHPLLGDDLYGGSRTLIGRQALHARMLSFPHPRTGEQRSFESPLPLDLKRVKQQLESR